MKIELAAVAILLTAGVLHAQDCENMRKSREQSALLLEAQAARQTASVNLESKAIPAPSKAIWCPQGNPNCPCGSTCQCAQPCACTPADMAAQQKSLTPAHRVVGIRRHYPFRRMFRSTLLGGPWLFRRARFYPG